MKTIYAIFHHTHIRYAWEAASLAVPVSFWLWLAYWQIVNQLHTLNPLPVLIAAESLLTGALLMKRKADSSAMHPWYVRAGIVAVAFLGPVLVEQKTPKTLAGFWCMVIVSALGLLLVIWALASLGTAFGIAPADRGLVTHGPYRYIRHPMYAGALLNVAAVVFANPTTWNAVVLAAILLVGAYRIYLEERTVTGYERYARQVPWRLIPGIF